MAQKFFENVPEDCKKEVDRVRRMKVFKLAALDDGIETFADVWWAILHEVDMFVEGEFTDVKEGAMTKAQAMVADKWLIDTVDLFNKYKNNDEFGVGDFTYAGQIDDSKEEALVSEITEEVDLPDEIVDGDLPEEIDDDEPDDIVDEGRETDENSESDDEERKQPNIKVYEVKFDTGDDVVIKRFECMTMDDAKEKISETEDELGWKKTGKLRKVVA